MTGRLIVVTGTGTGIGKTHLSVALLHALGRGGARVAGVKPVESGVGPVPTPTSDAALLAAASTFHVKHACITLTAPVSPHRAARLQGLTLDLGALARGIDEARLDVDFLVTELAGGLFSPVTDRALNAHLVARLAPDVLLLVAPDRLGVLHDILAAVRAAEGMALRFDGLVLIAPENPDASTGTNADELRAFTTVPVLATVPRAPVSALANGAALEVIVRALQAAQFGRGQG